MQTNNRFKVLLADDHAILRDGLKALFDSQPDLEVVAEAVNGRETIRLANERKPDLLVTDISMPLTNGTDAIRVLKRRHPNLKIIALTVHSVDKYVREALECGADGYVLKDDSMAELLRAIRHVLSGKRFLSAGISRAVVDGYLRSQSPDSTLLEGKLTRRECETLKLIAEGLKNKEIAAHLCVSVKTVEKHRANLMRKLDLHSGPALTAYAFENGLTTRHPSASGISTLTSIPESGVL